MRRGRPPYPGLLTPREQEVLALLREGLTNEEIARRLGISLAGAKYHVSEILSKLGVRSRQEATRVDLPPRRRTPALAFLTAFKGMVFAARPSAAAAWLLAMAAIGLLALGIREMKARQSLSEAPPSWLTYKSELYGFEFAYPSGWRLTEGSRLCDPVIVDFCTQHFGVEGGLNDEVHVFVNFQGGWCESSTPLRSRDIVVSGVSGREYECPGFTVLSFGPGDSLVRFFPDVSGTNYLVLGQSRTGLESVRPVVESFRFVP